MNIEVAGVAWYRREDYELIRKIMDDGGTFAPVYDDWLRRAEKTFNQIPAQGIRAIRAEIDPHTFPAWCAGKGLNVNSEARRAWGNLKAFESVHNG